MNDRIAILREAITKITQLLAGKGIKVTQRGMSAGVKHDAEGRPTEVNLPYLPDNCPEELVSAIQGFLDKEVANLLFTDYSIAVVAKTSGFKELFDIIEGIHVEKAIEKRFAGSAHNIGMMRAFFVNKFLRFEVKKFSAPEKQKQLTSLLLGPTFRAIAGQFEFRNFMDETGLMSVTKPIIDRLGVLMDEVEHVKSTAESFDLAQRMFAELKGEGGGEGEEGGEGGKPSKSKKGGVKGEKSSKPETAGEEGDAGEKGEEESKGEGEGEGEEGEGESEEGEGESEAGEEDEAETKGKEAPTLGDEAESKEGEEGSSGSGGEGEGEGEGERQEVEYREQDMSAAFAGAPNMADVISTITSKEVEKSAMASSYIPFTKDDDKVEKFEVKSGRYDFKDSMLKDLDDSVSHMVAPLQKDIERSISARTQSTWQAGQRRGRLNASGLARLATNDDRVFRRKEVSTSKDVAVELVIDCSGSMSGHKITIASQTAYALSQVLERLNIKHEVIGFTTYDGEAEYKFRHERDESKVSYSRVEALNMPIFKSFDERLDTETRRRLAFLPYWDGLQNNVDGECIEIAYRRLQRRPEHRKIMIVLSDGSPACHGNNSHIREHLKEVVKGVEKAKVDVIGIGICSDAVERFYSKNVVINNVDDLPGKVMGELKKMLMAGIK